MLNDQTPIHPVNLSDAAEIQSIYAPYVEETAISFETSAPSCQEISARIKKITATYPWYVYKLNQMILGYAYASEHRSRDAYKWSVDVAIYVKMGCSGQGIGSTLYDALLNQLNQLGYANAFAGIALPNQSSTALHKKFGFSPIGIYKNVGFKNGQWRDVMWWQKSFTIESQPASPIKFIQSLQ